MMKSKPTCSRFYEFLLRIIVTGDDYDECGDHYDECGDDYGECGDDYEECGDKYDECGEKVTNRETTTHGDGCFLMNFSQFRTV